MPNTERDEPIVTAEIIDEKVYGGLVGALVVILYKLVEFIIKNFRAGGNGGNGGNGVQEKLHRRIDLDLQIIQRELESLQKSVAKVETELDKLKENQNLLFLGRDRN